jgi:peptide/nickel transport system permease protein
VSVVTASVTVPSIPDARRFRVAKRLLRRPAAVIAALVVAGFIAVALAAPQLAPYGPNATNFGAIRKAPSALYRLGTDEVGRDLLSRLIWGARASLLAGVIPVSIAVVVSIPLGLLSGYVGGWVDGVIMRVTDAMLAIPFLIVAIALAAFLGPRLTSCPTCCRRSSSSRASRSPPRSSRRRACRSSASASSRRRRRGAAC